MSDLTLIIGNKNYSSWSLRPWLALRHAGIPFDERLLLLFDENWKEAIAAVSPSGRVPVLLHGERTVWETLAIIEYANELFPDAGLWPGPRHGRAIANEMHAGALRNHMPMNRGASPTRHRPHAGCRSRSTFCSALRGRRNAPVVTRLDTRGR